MGARDDAIAPTGLPHRVGHGSREVARSRRAPVSSSRSCCANDALASDHSLHARGRGTIVTATFLPAEHGGGVMHLTHNGSEIGISVCGLGGIASMHGFA